MKPYYFILFLLFGVVSCTKKSERDIQGDWDIVFEEVVTWGMYGDSVISNYPEDQISDWKFNQHELNYVSNGNSFPFRISDDTLFIETFVNHERYYQILLLTDLQMKLKKIDDPYFPNMEVHFVKL